MADLPRHIGRASFAAAAAAMIATPLAGRGRRAVLANVVVGGLAATTTAVAWRRWGGARSALAASATVAAATLVEKLGTTTGVPFGRYAYSGALRPRVAGVPMAVPAAWFAMALPARETAHAVLGPSSRVSSRVAVGAACLTAWDLFLDPQMTAEGHWQWRRPGRYRGIPATNFLGWFATSLGLMVLLESVLPPTEGAEPAAVALYAWMAAMQTLGFALFFRDPLVAVVGGLAMLPLAVVAARRAGLVTPLRARRGGGDG